MGMIDFKIRNRKCLKFIQDWGYVRYGVVVKIKGFIFLFSIGLYSLLYQLGKCFVFLGIFFVICGDGVSNVFGMYQVYFVVDCFVLMMCQE